MFRLPMRSTPIDAEEDFVCGRGVRGLDWVVQANCENSTGLTSASVNSDGVKKKEQALTSRQATVIIFEKEKAIRRFWALVVGGGDRLSGRNGWQEITGI